MKPRIWTLAEVGSAEAHESSLAMTEAMLRQVLALLPTATPAQRSIQRRVEQMHNAAALALQAAKEWDLLGPRQRLRQSGR